MAILSDDDIRIILSKAQYWNEVSHRENQNDILWQELNGEINRLGLKILGILEAYAKICKESKD